MSKEPKYFNFPIVLLEGFLVDDKRVLKNIFDYALYAHTLDYEFGDEEQMMSDAQEYFGVTCGNKNRTYENGENLYNSIPEKTPMVGINKDRWFDYYKNDKPEFDKVSLLGFLAIKSILQNKAYCKIDNKFWLSRMDGKAKSIKDNSELSKELLIYANEYQTKKIKSELIDNWGLVHYSRYTRGFYVSYNLNINDLVFEAEKRRKSTKEKQRKEAEQLALKKALERLK